MTQAKREYYHCYCDQLGVGTLHDTRAAALRERRELLAKHPGYTIRIGTTRMTPREKNKLPEFDGY